MLLLYITDGIYYTVLVTPKLIEENNKTTTTSRILLKNSQNIPAYALGEYVKATSSSALQDSHGD